MTNSAKRASARAGTCARKSGILLASTAIGLSLMGLAAPQAAWAADECGTAAVGATVTCPTTPLGGINYATANGNTVILPSGGSVNATNTANTAGVYVSGTGNLVFDGSVNTTITNTQTASSTGGVYVLTNGGSATAKADVVSTAGNGGIGVLAQGTTGSLANANTVTTTGLGSLNGNPAFGIAATTFGTGNATVNVGSVTTSGVNALAAFAQAANGSATTNVTTSNVSGANARGAYALTTTSGDATVNAGTVTSSGASAYGAQAVAQGTGSGTVNVTNASTSGASAFGVSVIASQGTGTVNAGTVTTTGTAAPGIGITALDGVVHATSVTTSGNTSNGVQVAGSHSATIDVGTVRTSGNVINGGGLTIGVLATGATLDVTATDVRSTGTGGLGIVANGTGNVTVHAGTTATTGSIFQDTNTGINYAPTGISATSTTGNVAITSNAVSTVGDVGTGLRARATTGTITINSGTVTTQGNGATGIGAIGGSSVSVTSGAISTSGAAIALTPVNGADVGSVIRYADDINAQSNNGSVVVNANGALSTLGAGAAGVRASGLTDATVTATNVSTAGGLATVNGVGLFGDGINVLAGSGTATVNAGTVTTAGAGSFGIWANGHNTAITATSVTTSGDGGNAIGGTSGGLTTVNAGAIRTTGNATTIAGVTSLASGVNVGGVTINVTTTDIRTTGAGAIGIVTNSTGNTTINAGITTASGGTYTDVNGVNFTTPAIAALSSAGNISITSGTASSAGNIGSAIFAASVTGNVSISSGTATATGNGSGGLVGLAGGSVSVTSTGPVSTSGSTVAMSNVNGISPSRTISQADGIHLESTNSSATVNATGAITTTGNGAAGIMAIAATGVTVNSTSISTTGNGLVVNGTQLKSDGIVAVGLAGPVLVNTGAVSVTGTAGTANTASKGVDAETNTGTLTVNVTGDVVSKNNAGVLLINHNNTADMTVNVAAGFKASGGVSGVSVQGAGVSHVTNLGRIDNTLAGSTLAALSTAGGALVLDSSGVISSANGKAVTASTTDDTLTFRAASSTVGGVQLLAGDDVVNVTAGAALQGIDAGAGTDTLNLSGTGAGAARGSSQAGFAGWDNFENVNVTGGAWTLSGAGAWNTLNIASGASLTTGQTAGLDYGLGVGPAGTLAITNAGTLTLTNTGNPLAAAPNDNVSITGAGALNLIGGNLVINNVLSGFTGQTSLSGNALLLTQGAIGGGVNIAAGSTLEVGGTLSTTNGVTTISGPGTTGSVAGAIADNGALIFNRSDSFTHGGAISGAGSLVKNGAGVLTLSGPFTFTGATTVNGGSINFGAPLNTTAFNLTAGTINLAAGANSIGNLGGTGGAINIAGGSSLTSGTGTFAGILAGGGSLIVNGASGSNLNLTGVNTFTGGTTIQSGLLSVNGSLASGVTVNGGVLGGNGTINGNVQVNSGGAINPGNSPGTLNVNGAVNFASGSTYTVETTPTQADKLIATGAVTIQSGATLAITPLGAISTYSRLGNYGSILTGSSLTGTFSTITNSLAFLTPHLTYTATSLNMVLTRNDVSFASLGANANQAHVAAAAEATGYGAPLYMALVVLDQPGSRIAYDALSGEGYGGVGNALIEQTELVRRTALSRIGSGDERALWGKVLAGSSKADSSVDFGEVHNDYTGMMFGADAGLGKWRLGAGLSYLDSNIDVLNGSADAKTTSLSAYAGGKIGSVSVKFSGGYAWHSIDMSRQIVFTGFSSAATSTFDANTSELSAEVSYALTAGKATYEPFASVGWDNYDADAVNEAGGGIAALKLASHSQSITALRVGVRGAMPLTEGGLTLRGSLAWRSLSGDTDAPLSASFAGGQTFSVAGAPLDDSAAEVAIRAEGPLGKSGTVDVSYRGAFGDRWTTNSIEAGLRWKF